MAKDLDMYMDMKNDMNTGVKLYMDMKMAKTWILELTFHSAGRQPRPPSPPSLPLSPHIHSWFSGWHTTGYFFYFSSFFSSSLDSKLKYFIFMSVLSSVCIFFKNVPRKWLMKKHFNNRSNNQMSMMLKCVTKCISIKGIFLWTIPLKEVF